MFNLPASQRDDLVTHSQSLRRDSAHLSEASHVLLDQLERMFVNLGEQHAVLIHLQDSASQVAAVPPVPGHPPGAP